MHHLWALLHLQITSDVSAALFEDDSLFVNLEALPPF